MLHPQNPISPSLLAFKPRQVLLSSCSNSMAQKDIQTLNPEQRTLFLRSIAGFLRRSDFSKTLKKFLSESQIEKNDLEAPSMNLERIFCQHLKSMSVTPITNTNGDKVEDEQEKGKSKKRKKGSDENDVGVQLDASEKKHKDIKKNGKNDSKSLVDSTELQAAESLPKEETKNVPEDVVSSEGQKEPDAETEKKTKDKKKKKNKPTSESIVQSDEQHVAENVPSEDKNAKSKKKKKLKKDDVTEISKDSEEQETEKPTLIKCTKDDDKTSNEDVADKESKKGSKKRKRKDAEENDTQVADEKAEEESKRRKKEDLKDDEGTKQPVEISAPVNSSNGAKQENEGDGQNSASQKSGKGKNNGSASAKKPFQRVNVEEVVFTDKRLEDNSYWAKSGADTGYGAKAQEILGQVRGKDFRHEKTKKKRGTYRGGQVDLQSHSVKFQYSDEE